MVLQEQNKYLFSFNLYQIQKLLSKFKAKDDNLIILVHCYTFKNNLLYGVLSLVGTKTSVQGCGILLCITH